MNKIRTFQILIAFLILTIGPYFGYQAYAHKMIDGKVFPEIAPGKVTLLGIDAGGDGYKIVVSNGVAQLIQTPKGPFEAPDMSAGGGDDADATDKRHVPLKEMVQSLQGNSEALSELVTQMNDDLRKYREDIYPNATVWKAEDLSKAIAGDKDLTKKLVHDTNANLDGTPADFINTGALYSGITIDLPVPVNVLVRGEQKTLVAHVKIPYRAEFTKKVEKDLNDKVKSLSPTADEMKGYYLEEADLLKGAVNRENVAKSISSRIAPEMVKGYADAAERILSNTKVILNESYVANARKDAEPTDAGKTLYNLVLDLNDEGRDRLWKYSRHQVGKQLLLIVNGVAIAAPFINHELEQKEVTITQMVDPDLVDDAVSTIKEASSSKG